MATLKIMLDDVMITEQTLDEGTVSVKVDEIKTTISVYEEIAKNASSTLETLQKQIGELNQILEGLKAVGTDDTEEDTEDDTPPIPDPLPENPLVIQDHIDDADSGDTILLPAGIYRQQMEFPQGKAITVKPEAGVEGHVIIDGRMSVDWDWKDEGNDTFSADYPGFENLWWWKDDDSRGNFNSQYTYPVLATIGDEPLLWKPDGNLTDVSFHINSDPEKSGTIRVKLRSDQSIEDFMISPFPWLVWGDSNCDGIELHDLTFRGCSNTGKTGMINTPGSNWKLINVTAELASTIGIELGQGGEKAGMKSTATGHEFHNVKSIRNGQMGWWGSVKNGVFVDCENSENNWKGFDPWWEASIKLEGCENCTFTNWRAVDNNGQGFWFDISNHRNTMDGFYAEGNMLAGLMVEHHADDNVFKNLEIKDTRKAEFDPNTSWGVVTGILIQSNVKNNVFETLDISGCEDGIRVNNTDSRGNSNNNTFKDCTFSNNGNNVRVLGDQLNNKLC